MRSNEIKRLVLFTAHYPYTNGESFLEDEMKYAANLFDEILIVTAEKSATNDRYYIPDHAMVIESRKGLKRYIGLLMACIHMFVPTTIREIKYGIREQKGIHSTLEILKKILITESNIATTKMSFPKWYSKEPTLYYAYWLDAEASYLSLIRNKLNGICIARAHGGDCFFDRDYHPFRRRQLSMLDKIYPISEKGMVDIVQHYSQYVEDISKKVQTMYLGIPVPSQCMNPWMKKEEATVVSCAEVKGLKRIDLMIDALRIIDRPIHWIHFGDGELMEDIERYAHKQLDGLKNIRFEFTGRILKDDILKFYKEQSVDVFVNTSDQEGIPVSIMEAMSYGIPVVARDIGGNSELVSNECGILVSSQVTPQKIAEAIRRVLEMDRMQNIALRKTARDVVFNDFNETKNYERFYRYILCCRKEIKNGHKRV